MFLVDLHCRFALSTIFYALALGLWGVIAFVRGSGVSGNYFGSLIIGEVLVIAQGIIGVALVITGAWPADVLHFLYGVVIAISWPGIFAYTGGERTRREMGFYAFASFFIFGLAVRAIMTGAGSNPLVCFPR